MLFGRETECALIADLLARARSGAGFSLVIRGEPGVGKTELIGHVSRRELGFTVMRVVGFEPEGAVRYAGLHQLIAPMVPQLGRLPERQARALRAALGEAESVDADLMAIYAGVFSLLSQNSSRNPLLVTVDDSQWLDSETLDALGFVARRVENEAIGVLFTARSSESFDMPGVPELVLGGLSESAGVALVGSAAPSVSPEVARELTRVTQGNPLALVELPGALDDDQRAGRKSLDDPISVTRAIERAFLSRLATLSDAARDALLLAAVGEPGDAETLLQTGRVTLARLHEAENSGLVRITQGRLEFRHPLVRSAVQSAAGESARRAAHAVLAQVLDPADPVRSAWHRALSTTGVDEALARILTEVAEAARRSGAAGTAARLFEVAAEKSPSLPDRARRLLAAGEAAWLAGRSPQALRLVSRVEGLSTDLLLLADAELLRWRVVSSAADPADLFNGLVRRAWQIAGTDPQRAAVMLAFAADFAFDVMDMGRARSLAHAAFDLLDSEPEDCEVLSALSWVWVADCRVDDALSVTRQILDRLAGQADLQVAFACDILSVTDRHDEAERLIEPVVAKARRTGQLPLLTYSLGTLAVVRLRRGQIVSALSTALEALAAIDMRPPWAPLLCAQAAEVEAVLGMADACRQHAADACAMAWRGTGYAVARAHAAVGLLDLGAGQVELAVTALERAHALAWPLRHPGFIRYAGDLVEALIRSGETARAESLLLSLERRGHEAGSRWAVFVALRCRLLLAPEDEIRGLYETAAALPESPMEHARLTLVYGERLRRARLKGQARAALERAHAQFTALGTVSWAERTRSELRATGARLGTTDEASHGQLSPQELRVALVVAEGLTNREAAARLFLSPKTVEFHLSSAYRKLQVRSRTELARKLAMLGP